MMDRNVTWPKMTEVMLRNWLKASVRTDQSLFWPTKKPPRRAALSAGKTLGSISSRSRHEWFIVAAAVNCGHLGTHGTQGGGEFSAMVDAVIVEKSQVQGSGKIESSEEIHAGGELLG